MRIKRRHFILSSAVVGGGVLIGYSATRPSSHRQANDELAQGSEKFLTSFIKIDPNNKITIYVPHSEMGQGIHTSLAMMAADELESHLAAFRAGCSISSASSTGSLRTSSPETSDLA